jgi:hypothetical protein
MTRTLSVNVKSKYLAIKGTTADVGGKIFVTKSWKRFNAKSIDIHNVIFSPAAVGKQKTIHISIPIKPVGTIKLTV